MIAIIQPYARVYQYNDSVISTLPYLTDQGGLEAPETYTSPLNFQRFPS